MRIDRIQSLSQNHEEGRLHMISSDLFTYDFDQYPLPPSAVEVAVKDMLPGAKIETSVDHGDNHFAAHDLTFHMSVSVVFAGVIVPALTDGRVGGQPFQPLFIVGVQTPLVVVDEHAGRNVRQYSTLHGIYKGQSPLCRIPLSFPRQSRPLLR
jgi:hypothetical protein